MVINENVINCVLKHNKQELKQLYHVLNKLNNMY